MVLTVWLNYHLLSFFGYYHLLYTHVICSFLVFIYKITLPKVGLRADVDRAAVAKVIEPTRL
jgi:hypothetical protein